MTILNRWMRSLEISRLHANDDRIIIPIDSPAYALPKMMPDKHKQSLTNMDRYLEGFKIHSDSISISWPRGKKNAMHSCG